MPANTLINVTPDELRNSAKECRVVNKDLRNTLDDIQKRVNTLAGGSGSWLSEAAREISQKLNTFGNKRFPEFESVVESYCVFLDKSAADYDATESTLKSNASQFQ